MRRPMTGLLVALTVAGCSGQPAPPTTSRSAAADGFTQRPQAQEEPPGGGSKAAPYVLIGVAIGVGLILLALSDTAMMPDTSYPE